MQLSLLHGLPFVRVILTHERRSVILDNVMIDTGSANSIFSRQIVAQIGILISHEDVRHRVSGVGGSEVVWPKRVEFIRLGDAISGPVIRNAVIEVGTMEYGFSLQGILGMDILRHIGATIDLDAMTLTNARSD